MSESTTKSATDMIELFPAKPEPIRGEPTLLELLRILNYLVDCSQTHDTDISPVNMMFVALPARLYSQYTATVYPTQQAYADPGIMPNYAATINATERATAKATYEHAKKNFLEVKNMNKALSEVFLQLIPSEYTHEFREARRRNPNQSFRQIFDNFLATYGQVDAIDRKLNTDKMEDDWHPSDGIQKLITQIEDGVKFAYQCGIDHNISDAAAVDIAIRVATKSGLLQRDHELWLEQNDHSWLNFKNFWTRRLLLRKRLTRAGDLGYGMNATENAAADKKYDDTIMQFGTAYSAAQEAMKKLADNNTNLTSDVANSVAEIQQKMSDMQMQLQAAMATLNQQQRAPQAHPPPPTYQRQTAPPMPSFQPYAQPPAYPPQQQYAAPQPFQNNGGRGGRGGGRGGFNGGRGGRGGRGGYGQRWNRPPQAQYMPQHPQQQPAQSYPPAQNQSNQPTPYKSANNANYCWTHGGDIADDHTSHTCGQPRQGHVHAATRANAMGGNPRGANRTIMPGGGHCQPVVGCGPKTNFQHRRMNQPQGQYSQGYANYGNGNQGYY